MQLDGPQIAELQALLIAAYDLQGLAQMVRKQLDEKLEEFADCTNLSNATFDLIEWAQQGSKKRP